MRKLLILFLSLSSQICSAQFVERITEYLSPDKSQSELDGSISIFSEKPVTSLVLGIAPWYSFGSSFIIAEKDTFYLQEDEHGVESGKKFSHLLVLPNPLQNFEFFYRNIRDTIEVYTINDKLNASGFPIKTETGTPVKTGSFEMPKMMDQSDWRYGLKEPDFDRIVHKVNNVIVHHSASSNLVTDYTSAIRNIYLYHTEVRGWSDIGYNYLIAPDGAIYKGRDPGTNEQDLVMGAHFCSSNRGTMGICMLGTFTEIAPTDTASDSLEKLLVWKLGKDTMDPLGIYAHQLNPTLKVIAGHRDGCATECPGEILYDRLSLMRDRVNNKIQILGIELIGSSDFNDDIHFFPNPVEHMLSITSAKPIELISVLTIDGKFVQLIKNPDREIDFSYLGRGQYILSIQSADNYYSRIIIKK